MLDKTNPESSLGRNVLVRLLFVGSLVAPWPLSPLQAQATEVGVLGLRFNPHFTLGVEYTDNVRFVGEEENSDDSILRLGVSLPLVRELKRGSFAFTYGGTYSRYESFEDLDNLSHRLGLSVNHAPSPRSSLGFRINYSKTQNQGEAGGLEDLDLFLNRRTDREALSSTLSYSSGIASHWGWRGSLGLTSSRFDEISGVSEAPLSDPLEDRTTLLGGIGFFRERSAGNSIGLDYDQKVFNLDRTGKETVHLLSIRIGRHLTSDQSFSLAIGGFVRDDDAQIESAGLVEGSKEGLQGSLQFQRSLRRVNLGLHMSHSPSAGGDRRGTSTNSSVGLTLGGKGSRRWGWSTSVRYAQRSPRSKDLSEIDSIAFGGSVRTILLRNVSLTLRGSYVDQDSDTQNDRGSYYRAGLGLAFHKQQRGAVSALF